MPTINNTLTQLLLKNNQLKDREMNAIAFALQNNISLTKLDVRNNDLTDRCFEGIVQLLSVNRDLTEVLFTENEFSNEIKEQFKNTEDKYGPRSIKTASFMGRFWTVNDEKPGSLRP